MKQTTLKRGVDLLLTAALLALMPYSLIGEATHEWIGMRIFLLFLLHLALHWAVLLNGIRRFAVTRTRGFRMLGWRIASYGAFAFWKRDFPDYLFLRTHFLFLDYEEPIVLFFLDYLAIMGLFVFCAHSGGRLLQRKKTRAEKDD